MENSDLIMPIYWRSHIGCLLTRFNKWLVSLRQFPLIVELDLQFDVINLCISVVLLALSFIIFDVFDYVYSFEICF